MPSLPHSHGRAQRACMLAGLLLLVTVACGQTFGVEESDSPGSDTQSGVTSNASLPSWNDPNSGLEWTNQKEPQRLNYPDAPDYCQQLSPSIWRLPTIDEARTLLVGCQETLFDGPCNVSLEGCLGKACGNDECDGCQLLEGPYNGYYAPGDLEVREDWYWTASMVSDSDRSVWIVRHTFAAISTSKTEWERAVRCVR